MKKFQYFIEALSPEGKAKMNILNNTTTERTLSSYNNGNKEWIKNYENNVKIYKNKPIPHDNDVYRITLYQNNYYFCNAYEGLHDDILIYLIKNEGLMLKEEEFKEWHTTMPSISPFLNLQNNVFYKNYICISESYDLESDENHFQKIFEEEFKKSKYSEPLDKFKQQGFEICTLPVDVARKWIMKQKKKVKKNE